MPEDMKFTKKQLRQIITQGALVCKENSKYKSHKNILKAFNSIIKLYNTC